MEEHMRFKIEPYEWQHRAIKLSDEQPNVALLADMGTGKTGAMVNILRLKYGRNKRILKTLILSPLVTLFNWRNEFKVHSFIDTSIIHPLYGTSVQKLKRLEKAIASGKDAIIVTNYETMISPTIVEALTKWGPEVLVLDESHLCKNHKAKRSKIVEKLSKQCMHRYLMTGTAIANSVEDIFMQYKIMDGGETFGNNFYTFQRTYMYDANAAWAHRDNHFPKWVVRPEMIDVIQSKMFEKAIRVTKAECMDLPPRVEEVYRVPLSPSQEKYYKQMERDLVTYIIEGEKQGIAVAQLAITKALRLQQIVTGFVIDDQKKVIEIEDNPRLKVVEELISALHVEHKVILWCSFRHNYIQLGRLMQDLGIEYVTITGDDNLKEKDDAMFKFNNEPQYRVAICNRRAAGIGVNLVAASYSIVYSRNFSLTEELQSKDRNYRGGSQIHDKITNINLCAMDTIDEKTTEDLLAKKNVSDSILSYFK
jgi:SNF2 family DNA or RNA helicase